MTRNSPGSTPALIFACKSIAGLSEDGPREEETNEPKSRGIIISAHCPKCGHDPQIGKSPRGEYSRIEDDGTVTDVVAGEDTEDDGTAN